MKILVTGATGLIGKVLCRELSEQGHTLVTTSRRAGAATALGRGIFGFQWNPESGPLPAEALAGVDGVVHLAGEPVAARRWTEEQKRKIRDSRVIGTRNLVRGLMSVRMRPGVLVSGSAVGYYGSRGDEKLDEKAPAGRGFLSDVCQQWEREGAAAGELGVRVAHLRTGVVLSADGGALPKMMPAFKLGVGGRLGDGRQWFPWIHVDDLVGLIIHALGVPTIGGPINGAAPGIVTNAEFTRELASVLRRPSFFAVPEAGLRLLMGEMAEVLLTSQRAIPQVALETGYRFRFADLRPALEHLLDQGRRQASAPESARAGSGR